MTDPVTASLEPRTEAGKEQLTAMRRVVEQMRELCYPEMVGQPIPQEAATRLVLAIEEQAATEARRELLAKVEGLPLTTPDLAPRDYAGRRNVKEGPLRLYRAAVLRLIEESDHG